MTAASAKAPRGNRQQQKATARLYAVQALFQMEAARTPLPEIIREFETHRIGVAIEGDIFAEADMRLFRTILKSAVSQQARIDQMTDRALVAAWPINRIDPTLRAVFRAAGAELIDGRTPPKVAITEYVDVAKAFNAAGKEAGFVNAVLDHMAREARPDIFGERPKPAGGPKAED
ncbi:MAG: transcription antitermination factor NusB [Pseudomonadota bacterium]